MHSKNDIIPINQHNGGKPMRKWKKAGTIGLIAVMLCAVSYTHLTLPTICSV